MVLRQSDTIRLRITGAGSPMHFLGAILAMRPADISTFLTKVQPSGADVLVANRLSDRGSPLSAPLWSRGVCRVLRPPP
jgi:hypothetical protein